MHKKITILKIYSNALKRKGIYNFLITYAIYILKIERI